MENINIFQYVDALGVQRNWYKCVLVCFFGNGELLPPEVASEVNARGPVGACPHFASGILPVSFRYPSGIFPTSLRPSNPPFLPARLTSDATGMPLVRGIMIFRA